MQNLILPRNIIISIHLQIFRSSLSVTGDLEAGPQRENLVRVDNYSEKLDSKIIRVSIENVESPLLFSLKFLFRAPKNNPGRENSPLSTFRQVCREDILFNRWLRSAFFPVLERDCNYFEQKLRVRRSQAR